MSRTHFANPLRILSSRNCRLYFYGQAISLAGTWMTYTATLWYIYHLTSSSFSVGLFGFMTQVPNFLLGPVGGALVDRMNRRLLLMITQAVAMVQALGLAALALTNNVTPLWLFTFAVLQGVVNAFEWPARAALLIDLIGDRDQLGNAIALNSSLFNVARFLGSALAGLIIVAWGPAICYFIDGLSYSAIVVFLGLMRLPRFDVSSPNRSVLGDIREGVIYVWSHRSVLLVLELVIVISFFGSSYYVLLPQLARDVIGADARTLGFLLAACGGGALAAALYLSMRPSSDGLGRMIVIGGLLISAAIIILPRASALLTALACMVCIGLGSVLVFVSCNTTVQSLVMDDKRGRVSAIFTMAFTGTAPLASLVMGWSAQHVGGVNALAGAGCICLFATVRYQRARPRIRIAMEKARAMHESATLAAAGHCSV